MKVDVYKLPQNSPDDLTALKAAIASGEINPQEIVAILGKTPIQGWNATGSDEAKNTSYGVR